MSFVTLIPTSSADVNKDWLRNVMLRSSFAPDEVEVKSLTPVEEVNGYLSSVFTAEVVMTKGSEMSETHNLFIKVMPSEEASRDFIEINKLDRTEIQAYKILIPELIKFEKANFSSSLFQKLTPRFFAGYFDLRNENRGFFLVLENLTPEYQTRSFNSALSKSDVVTALVRLAEFHAIAHAFAKKNDVQLKEKFPFLSNFMDMDKYLLQETLDNECLDIFLKSLDGSPDCDELTDVAKMRFKSLCHNYLKYAIGEEDMTTFLMHGDCWANNFMFSENSTDCKLVDWQFVTTGSVIIDFGLLALLSMDPSDTEANLETFIKEYYTAFHRKLNQVELPMPWTMEQFRNRILGSAFFATLTWSLLAIVLVEKHPSFGPRIHWVLKKCLQYCPEKLS